MDVEVLGFAEARAALRAHVDTLNADPSHPPVVFGSRRVPEAALLSYEGLSGLLDGLALLEDLGISQVVADRTGRAESDVVTFDTLVTEAGLDPSEL